MILFKLMHIVTKFSFHNPMYLQNDGITMAVYLEAALANIFFRFKKEKKNIWNFEQSTLLCTVCWRHICYILL